MKKFNRESWNKQRLEIEAQIRAVKHGIRREDKKVSRYDLQQSRTVEVIYRGGTMEEWTSLKSLKETATWLYQMRAAYRGRPHLQSQWKLSPYNGTWSKEPVDARRQIEAALAQAEGWNFLEEVPEEPQAALA